MFKVTIEELDRKDCLLTLRLLNNFDRNDFILWFPIGLIIIHGIKKTLK